VTSLLHDQHWLPITERIEYKLRIPVFRCLQCNTPGYIADVLCRSEKWPAICEHFHFELPRTLVSSGTELFLLQACAPGTVVTYMFALPSQYTLLENCTSTAGGLYGLILFLSLVIVRLTSSLCNVFQCFLASNKLTDL